MSILTDCDKFVESLDKMLGDLPTPGTQPTPANGESTPQESLAAHQVDLLTPELQHVAFGGLAAKMRACKDIE